MVVSGQREKEDSEAVQLAESIGAEPLSSGELLNSTSPIKGGRHFQEKRAIK
jgi:predicted dinucleotide-binding enzyme